MCNGLPSGYRPCKDQRVKPVSRTLFLPDRPIVLVGMMGVGKSAIGRRLAQHLNIPFFDADFEIERAAGRSVSDIFSDFGEDDFRRGERAVIARLLSGNPGVLALGGGAFTSEQTRALVNEKATSVWLKATLEILVERVSRRDTRPLLKGRDPAEVITALLASRGPLYAQAHVHIDSDCGPPMRVVKSIERALMAKTYGTE